MTPAPPQGVANALGRVRPPWRAELTYGTGTFPVQRKADVPRGDGTYETWNEDAPAESWALRAAGPDGRRAVALWVRPAGRTWKFLGGWRGRHDDEHGPAPLNSDQLTDYTKE